MDTEKFEEAYAEFSYLLFDLQEMIRKLMKDGTAKQRWLVANDVKALHDFTTDEDIDALKSKEDI